jgi:hypothetical protein
LNKSKLTGAFSVIEGASGFKGVRLLRYLPVVVLNSFQNEVPRHEGSGQFQSLCQRFNLILLHLGEPDAEHQGSFGLSFG